MGMHAHMLMDNAILGVSFSVAPAPRVPLAMTLPLRIAIPKVMPQTLNPIIIAFVLPALALQTLIRGCMTAMQVAAIHRLTVRHEFHCKADPCVLL